MKAPFPWFGGKSRVADVVWRAFGNVPNYVEPFAGSLAVLLGRPHDSKIETVNDRDCYLSNFWRAVQRDPVAVAESCDWPVNEADLHARHRWLVTQRDFRERMLSDPDFFDAKVAGWWVWGLSQWIGGGWCSVKSSEERTRPRLSGQQGIQIPAINGRSEGMGVHRKTPSLSTHSGRRPRNRSAGVTADGMLSEQIPAIGNKGHGVNATRIPSLGNMRGVHGESKAPCAEWFVALQERLRRVRVCCGDWVRVLGDSVLGTTKSRNSGMNPCGLFLDPPYSGEMRDKGLYATDDAMISQRVAEWARAHGDDPDLRIALCGYEGEHEMPDTWTKHAWKAHRGYAGDANGNVHKERVWFSPHCLPLVDVQGSLFGVVA